MSEDKAAEPAAKRDAVHFYVFADSDLTEGDEHDQKLLDDKLTAAFLMLRRRYQSDQVTVSFFDGSGVNDYFDLYLPGFAVSTRSLTDDAEAFHGRQQAKPRWWQVSERKQRSEDEDEREFVVVKSGFLSSWAEHARIYDLARDLMRDVRQGGLDGGEAFVQARKQELRKTSVASTGKKVLNSGLLKKP